MKKHMTQEAAIKSAWMILEGLGYDRARNGDLEKTVIAVFESAPAADVVEVVRCRECKDWDTSWAPTYARHGEHFCPRTDRFPSGDWFCAYGERKDGGQDE